MFILLLSHKDECVGKGHVTSLKHLLDSLGDWERRMDEE